MIDASFVEDVLVLFADNDECESLLWMRDHDHGVRFFVNVGDVFDWGTADAEYVTPANLDVLRGAFRDAVAAEPVVGAVYADSLFAARIRGQRPQGAYYEHIGESLWPLFDACGPEREVNVCNPKPQPRPKPSEPPPSPGTDSDGP